MSSSSDGELVRIGSTPLVDATGAVFSLIFAVEVDGWASVGFEIGDVAAGSPPAGLDCCGVLCDVVAVGTTGGGKRAEIVEYCDMSDNEASISN